MWMLLLVAPMQAFIGDQHGLNTLEHQPAKIAAIEGHWENTPGEARAADAVRLARHGGARQRATRSTCRTSAASSSRIRGTDSSRASRTSRREDRPEFDDRVLDVPRHGRARRADDRCSALWAGCGALARRRSTDRAPFLRFALLMGPAGVVAILAGWFTTEIGRQPWVVYGVMRTADARVVARRARSCGVTLVLFVVVYFAGVRRRHRLHAAADRDGPVRARRRGSRCEGGAGRSRATRCGRCRAAAVRAAARTELEHAMGIDLPLIWAVIILFGVMMYVVMDGFDLGIGILYPVLPGKEDRDVMMNTVAPVWDGNETWLVLGGAGLLAAFPLAYSVVLSRVLPAADPDAAGPDLPRRRVRVPLQGRATARAALVGQGLHRRLGRRRRSSRA